MFIYIPLCIYFNIVFRATQLEPANIYIPLCIYFNGLSTCSMTCGSVFTFHYVSISTGSLMGYTSTHLIYMPLCIYFNTISRGKSYINDINLHSTMYLFQPLIDTALGVGFPIYIPLCIYFNPFWNKSQCTRSKIYIPLCIYFNSVILACASARSLFTFHYVSISTHGIYCQTTRQHHLHSTMYLFQQYQTMNHMKE